jgi:uncharacterized protein
MVRIRIISSTSDQARIEGALKLGVEPDEVAVEPIDDDTYDVSMMNAPGQFDIVILERHMVAMLKIITPPIGKGKPVAVQDIEKALADQKIVSGINKEVIKNIVSEVAETGSSRKNIQIAAGELFKDGIDSRIEYKFRLNGEDPETVDICRQRGKLDAVAVRKEMFSAGDLLALKIPPEKPVKGCTITGKALLGTEPKDRLVVAGKNVTLLKDNVTYVVSDGIEVGYADYVDGCLSVEEPLRVSGDKLRACLSVHPPSESGRMLSMEIVEKMLSDHGIVQGIDRNAIERVLEKARTGDMPVHNAVIAIGMAPDRGVDAQIKLKFQTEKKVGTIDPQSGVIDYKDRQTLQTVKVGDVLAVKVPLTLGKEGIDVYGEIIPAGSGCDKILTPVNNVEVSDDGLIFTSSIDGVVTLTQDNKLEVLKQLDVPSDVDYSTGNLSMQGELDIKGWIRSGFKVNATGEIRVSGGVEDAKVESGADIYIKGGIIGSGEGSVRAGGNLTVRFLENAAVHAEGNIFVRDDIVRSNVSANGSISATGGKGRIRGGVVVAGKNIEMYEIGSPTGVLTYVSVGVASKLQEDMVNISNKLSEYRKNRSKMDLILNKYEELDKGKQIQKEIQLKIRLLTKQRRDLIIEEERIEKEREKMAQKLSLAEDELLAVKVKEAVYSGTTVVVNGYAYKVNDDIKGKVAFIFDREEQAIKLIR